MYTGDNIAWWLRYIFILGPLMLIWMIVLTILIVIMLIIAGVLAIIPLGGVMLGILAFVVQVGLLLFTLKFFSSKIAHAHRYVAYLSFPPNFIQVFFDSIFEPISVIYYSFVSNEFEIIKKMSF